MPSYTPCSPNSSTTPSEPLHIRSLPPIYLQGRATSRSASPPNSHALPPTSSFAPPTPSNAASNTTPTHSAQTPTPRSISATSMPGSPKPPKPPISSSAIPPATASHPNSPATSATPPQNSSSTSRAKPQASLATSSHSNLNSPSKKSPSSICSPKPLTSKQYACCREKRFRAAFSPAAIAKHPSSHNSHYENLDGVERCIDGEIPFEIPDSWKWVRLIDICEYIQRGKSPKYSPIKKYPVIAQKCNQWSGFSIEKAQFIEPKSIASYGKERILQDNDLMWNSTGLGTLGRMAIYKSALNPYELAVADSHVTVIRPLKRFISPQYLYYYFSNPTVQSVIEDQADGTTKQKELSATTVRAYWVPLPPYNEQLRIVNQIEAVLPLVVQI